jgi:hypothetical protein
MWLDVDRENLSARVEQRLFDGRSGTGSADEEKAPASAGATRLLEWHVHCDISRRGRHDTGSDTRRRRAAGIHE